MDPPIDPLRAFRLLAHSDLAAPAPELSRPIGAGPQVGDVLEGRFRLDELLARGGMGQVFRAQDTALERPVAIKTLLLPGGEARLRFSREAELTARLRHAHVLQVHGSGEAAGSCYIVYELIEGARTLEDALAVLDLDGRLDLLEQVAEGVGAAHALGIVHRDLKPQNVLVRPGGSALVADFGVAHMETSSLTVSGQMLGTPAYMAPEQVNGEPITPATDVWSLGIMLYEALYGRHPFADALGLPALMQRIQDVELDCPAGPPRPLVRLLTRRLLVAAPAERVADGDAFLRELRAARAERARPPRRAAAATALLVVLSLATLGAWAAWPSPPPPAPPPAASATKAPPLEPASADEPPPRLARARWPLPLEFGRVHAAAWLGDRLLLAFQWRTSLYEADGREVASWPTALHPLAWTGDALFARDERDTFLLRADGTPPSKVLPFPAESCDPVAGRLVVRGEGELRAFDASGTLLRRFPLPDGLTPKQAFATPERLLVVVDAPNPRFLAFPWGPGPGQFVEGDLSPGRLDLRLSPDRERMALSGQSGFVWIYDAADLEAPPLRLRRARPEETSLARMFHVPHLVGVRGVLFWGDRLLTWGRGDTESDLLIWTRQGELEAVRSAAEVQALALGAHGMLARISKDQVEVFPAEELLERE